MALREQDERVIDAQLARCRQVQRLLACLAELIDEDAAQAGERSAVIAGRRTAVAALAGEGEQDLDIRRT